MRKMPSIYILMVVPYLISFILIAVLWAQSCSSKALTPAS